MFESARAFNRRRRAGLGRWAAPAAFLVALAGASWIGPSSPPVHASPVRAQAQGYGSADGTATPTTRPGSVTLDNRRPGRGDRVLLRITTGFAPRSTVRFFLLSNSVQLGEASADVDGTVEVALVIPEDAEAGPQEIAATGQGPTGAPVRVTVPLEVLGAGLSNLAFTGNNPASLVALGAMLVVMGAAATVAARRRLATALPGNASRSSWPN